MAPPAPAIDTVTGAFAGDEAIGLHSERLSNQLELLINSAAEYAICMLDPHGAVVIWNQGAERIFGWTENEILGQHHRILFPADAIAAGTPNVHLATAFELGALHDRSWRIRRDGTGFLASVTLTRVRDRLGRDIGFGKLVRDVTSEQAQSDAIETREMHLRSILATVPDAMVVIDEHGIILSFSTAAEILFGYAQAEALGRGAAMLLAAADREAHDVYVARYGTADIPRAIGSGRRVMGRRRDGSQFPLQLSLGDAVGGGKRVFTAFMRDLTAHEHAQGQLRKVQNELLHLTRVGAMGAMASTLAHELNQPLTAVANYVHASRSLLEVADAPSIAAVREALKVAEGEVLRAGNVVRQLRAFVARGETEKKFESVAELITDSCLLGLAGTREEGIVSRVNLAPSLGMVFIDRVQIQQVLINLIRNAVEAMAPNRGGQLLIDAFDERVFVRISVADTGPGLSPEVSERLFEAFVSTKDDGMGLGLSICRTIVEAHGGRIWHEAGSQGGTAFHFTVPLATLDDDRG